MSGEGRNLICDSVCVASVFVLVESWKYDQHTIHVQYDSALFSAWAAVEVNMAVFAGNSYFRLVTPNMFH